MVGKIILIIKELTGSLFISIIVFAVTTISASATLSFDIIGSNFNGYINKNFTSSIPPDTIKVRPKTGKNFFIFTSKVKKLDNKAIRKISRIRGVKNVDPILSVNVPCQGRISFFTFSYRTDLVCVGVPYRIIKKDLRTSSARKLWLQNKPSKEIPIIIPSPLIDSYNSGIAEANGLPSISPQSLPGFAIDLLVGHSSLTSLNDKFSTAGKISGTTRALNIMGIIIPLKSAKYINKRFKKEDNYRSANIQIKNHRDISLVQQKIKKMGFDTIVGGNLSEKIINLKRTVNTFIYSMTAIVSLLAIICTALCCIAAIWGRLEYYRILRMLGASKLFIGFTIIFRFALTGFIAGLCALALIKTLNPMVSESLKLLGMNISFVISPTSSYKILIATTLLPTLSCIFAIIKIFTAKLNTK